MQRLKAATGPTQHKQHDLHYETNPTFVPQILSVCFFTVDMRWHVLEQARSISDLQLTGSKPLTPVNYTMEKWLLTFEERAKQIRGDMLHPFMVDLTAEST